MRLRADCVSTTRSFRIAFGLGLRVAGLVTSFARTTVFLVLGRTRNLPFLRDKEAAPLTDFESERRFVPAARCRTTLRLSLRFRTAARGDSGLKITRRFG